MGFLMLDCSIEEDTIAARLFHDGAQLNLILLIISRDTKSRKVIGKIFYYLLFIIYYLLFIIYYKSRPTYQVEKN